MDALGARLAAVTFAFAFLLPTVTAQVVFPGDEAVVTFDLTPRVGDVALRLSPAPGRPFAVAVVSEAPGLSADGLNALARSFTARDGAFTFAAWPRDAVTDVDGRTLRSPAAPTLNDSAFRAAAQAAAAAGHEPAWQTASEGWDDRAAMAWGFDRFRDVFGADPAVGLDYFRNRENAFGGDGRNTSGAFAWRDQANERLTYYQRFTGSFLDVSRIESPEFPHVPFRSEADFPPLFPATRLATAEAFVAGFGDPALDALERSHASAIVLTAFGRGFVANGNVVANVTERLNALADRGAWLVPAGTLLARLEALRDIDVTGHVVTNLGTRNVTNVTVYPSIPFDLVADGSRVTRSADGGIVIPVLEAGATLALEPASPPTVRGRPFTAVTVEAHASRGGPVTPARTGPFAGNGFSVAVPTRADVNVTPRAFTWTFIGEAATATGDVTPFEVSRTVTAAALPRPDVDIAAVPRVPPGGSGAFTVNLRNLAIVPADDYRFGFAIDGVQERGFLGRGEHRAIHAGEPVPAFKPASFSLGTLAPGERRSLEVNVTVPANAAPGVYTVTLTVGFDAVREPGSARAFVYGPGGVDGPLPLTALTVVEALPAWPFWGLAGLMVVLLTAFMVAARRGPR